MTKMGRAKCPEEGCEGRLNFETYADVWVADDEDEYLEEYFLLVCDTCGYEEDA